jgi:hypothetical protein
MSPSGVLIGRTTYRANEGGALKKRQSNYILEIECLLVLCPIKFIFYTLYSFHLEFMIRGWKRVYRIVLLISILQSRRRYESAGYDGGIA